MIVTGAVLVAGSVAEKPARLVSPDEPIELVGPGPRFVSRGGEKLDAALARFGIDVTGLTAFDAGASTGGFSDCLLQRGVTTVVCADVGHGQLHEKLRGDPRVEVLERTHVAELEPERFGERFGIVVADLSFISLRRVARVLTQLTRDRGTLVVLVKPQFESGRHEASKARGVIRDPSIWHRVLDEVITAFRAAGATMMGVMPSPLRGADGNVEFLTWFTRASSPDEAAAANSEALIEAAVAEAIAADDR